jgi:hypothetical protein
MAAIERTYLATNTCRYGKETRTAAADTLDIYRATAKLRSVGTVEAASEAEAIEKAAKKFKVITTWSGTRWERQRRRTSSSRSQNEEAA